MRDIVDHRYRVEQKLAAGGFGAIYRATDLSIDRPVALKVLHRELAGDPSVVARFRQEAAALAKLRSPHTLTLYDVGETEDTLYLVMELLRGESLQEVFDREGPLSWRRVARIAEGVCSSLREAHGMGIVHRDLKPANIFLESHGAQHDFAKVLDFGIAKVLDSRELPNPDLTRHGQTVGTFDYMAPEQMIGGRCTFKSDVFTLGIVMYEMIAGSRPYGDATSPQQMVMALLTTVPKPLVDLPAELARLILRCIAREPHQRPDISEIHMVLERLLVNADSGFHSTPEAATVLAPFAADEKVSRRHVMTPSRPSGAVDPISGTMRGPPAPPLTPARRLGTPSHDASLPPGKTRTLPRGSATPLRTSADLAGGAPLTLDPPDDPLETAATVLVRDVGMAELDGAFAVGTSDSANQYAAYTPMSGIDEPRVMRPLTPALAPTPSASALPAPKGRLAAGTTPPRGTQITSVKPVARDSASLMVLRASVIAACLFALGFLVAMAIATL